MPAYATPTLLPGGTVILRFFDAFNSGQVDAALELLDETVRVSDCDFDHVQDVEFEGKAQVAEWLGQRIADHDQLFVSRVWGGALQPGVFGIDFDRRRSNTLRRLGFPDGAKYPSAKVVVVLESMLIDGIALGPGPASIPSVCRPEPYA